jgi:hypothetical protein
MKPSSWVIVRKDDGKAVFETFSPKVAEAVNRDKYNVVSIVEYLYSLNRKVPA